MSLETEIIRGSYTSDGSYQVLQIPTDVDIFELTNYTNQSSTATPGVIKRAKWKRGMPLDSYLGVKNTDGAATDESVLGTTGGFRLIESSVNNYEAAKPVVAPFITAANPAVVTVTAHGYVTGDTVLVTGSTGMLQIAGLEFHVTRVDANNFQLTYLDASGYAAAATAGTVRRRTTPPLFVPRTRSILAITKAASAVVTFTEQHGYGVGEIIRFNVPAVYGMTEMDSLKGTITAVGASTVTVNIDSTTFTTFAMPASGATSFTHAKTVPVGDGTGVLTGAKINQGYRGLYLGGTVVGAVSDVVYWEAFRAAQNIT